MATWNISKDIKKKILEVSGGLDNDKRILFLLKNLGPQRFSSIQEYGNLSRSTISKYLKLHLEQKAIEKRAYSEKGVSQLRYFITKRGEERLLEEPIEEDRDLFYIHELNDHISKLSDLVEFYKEIGVDDTIIFQGYLSKKCSNKEIDLSTKGFILSPEVSVTFRRVKRVFDSFISTERIL